MPRTPTARDVSIRVIDDEGNVTVEMDYPHAQARYEWTATYDMHAMSLHVHNDTYAPDDGITIHGPSAREIGGILARSNGFDGVRILRNIARKAGQ